MQCAPSLVGYAKLNDLLLFVAVYSHMKILKLTTIMYVKEIALLSILVAEEDYTISN